MNINKLDNLLERITDLNQTIARPDSFLLTKQPQQDNNTIVVGASFSRQNGGKQIDAKNRDEVLRREAITAVEINREFLSRVKSLNVLIMDKPKIFEKADNETQAKLASSIIFVTVVIRENSTQAPCVRLYFVELDELRANDSNPLYFCAFIDSSGKWNRSGCSEAKYNSTLNRHECNCSHLTSFALLWLPQTVTTYYDEQDIASLVSQSLSIICFLIVLIHAIIDRCCTSTVGLRAYDLLPLISTASTTILFTFWIAMSTTVYTRIASQENKIDCFTSAKVLTYFVYFSLIFMLCIKSSVGYFNYLRFVRLFPEPSKKKLLKMFCLSVLISAGSLSFAIGFDSSHAYNITAIYSLKVCWFKREVIHYFLTIPVCIFLIINISILILVSRRILMHVRNATSPHATYERMKRCVAVLLSSCVAQGIGWLFGPLITVLDNDSATIFGWLFVICNGLEGLWTLCLYFIIRAQGLYEQKRVVAQKTLMQTKMVEIFSKRHHYSRSKNVRGDERIADGQMTKQNQFLRLNHRDDSKLNSSQC